MMMLYYQYSIDTDSGRYSWFHIIVVTGCQFRFLFTTMIDLWNLMKQHRWSFSSLSIELVPSSLSSCCWIPALQLRRSDHLIPAAALTTGYCSFRRWIYVKFKKLFVIHYDSPLALQLFLHSEFCHDLVRLHGHPVLNGVNSGVFKAWATNMALNYFFLFDA